MPHIPLAARERISEDAPQQHWGTAGLGIHQMEPGTSLADSPADPKSPSRGASWIHKLNLSELEDTLKPLCSFAHGPYRTPHQWWPHKTPFTRPCLSDRNVTSLFLLMFPFIEVEEKAVLASMLSCWHMSPCVWVPIPQDFPVAWQVACGYNQPQAIYFYYAI